jgi:hypothetical protein
VTATAITRLPHQFTRFVYYSQRRGDLGDREAATSQSFFFKGGGVDIDKIYLSLKTFEFTTPLITIYLLCATNSWAKPSFSVSFRTDGELMANASGVHGDALIGSHDLVRQLVHESRRYTYFYSARNHLQHLGLTREIGYDNR